MQPKHALLSLLKYVDDNCSSIEQYSTYFINVKVDTALNPDKNSAYCIYHFSMKVLKICFVKSKTPLILPINCVTLFLS